ncbi:hypothetical protein, partial [Priestia megaterium]|uniref:hypothetical protein n=1 Tax=Priestia megaterium TaxID=1404 RepID=UPI00300B172C
EPKPGSFLDNFVLKYGIEDKAIGTSKQHRINSICRYLLADENQENDTIKTLTFDMVKDIIENELSIIENDIIYSSRRESPKQYHERYPKLISLLRKDGYTIENNELKHQFPQQIAIQENEVYTLLKKYNFLTPLGHLNQAIENHTNNRWAAANGQLRPYVESLLDEMAAKIFSGSDLKPAGHPRRASLATCNPPIIIENLNEWASDGKGFFNAFYKRLHPAGPHPGLSDSEDSTFRLHLVLLGTSQLLRRFDAYMLNTTI